jgi:hypothetical protein
MWFFKKKKETTQMTNNISDQIIGAHHGFIAVRFQYQNRKPTLDYIFAESRATPIVGWRILDGVVLPISIGGDAPADDCVEVIVAPGGMYYDVSGRSWKSRDGWAQDCLISWKNWIAAQPQAPVPVAAVPKFGIIGLRPSGFITDPVENLVA